MRSSSATRSDSSFASARDTDGTPPPSLKRAQMSPGASGPAVPGVAAYARPEGVWPEPKRLNIAAQGARRVSRVSPACAKSAALFLPPPPLDMRCPL